MPPVPEVRRTRRPSEVVQHATVDPKVKNISPTEGALLVAAGQTDIHLGTGAYSYTFCDALAAHPLVAAAHAVRADQVVALADEQTSPMVPGWRVGLTNRYVRPTERDKRDIDAVRALIKNGGDVEELGGFPIQLRKMTMSSLVQDQVNFHPLLNPLTRQPYAFVCADERTIRRRVTQKEVDDGRISPYEGGYEQWMDGQLVQSYDATELSWGVRNGSNNYRRAGHGCPETIKSLSYLINLVTSDIAASARMNTGLASRIAFSVTGPVRNTKNMQSVQRVIEACLSGVRFNNKAPVLFFEDGQKFEVHDLGKQPTPSLDYEYWWAKNILANLGVSPEEVNIKFGNEGQKSQVASNSSNKDQFDYSLNRGLVPLLKHIASWINTWLIWPWWPHISFSFEGYSASAIAKEYAADLEATKSVMSIDEFRARWGWAPFNNIVSKYPDSASFAPLIEAEIAQGMAKPPKFEFDSIGAFVNGARIPAAL